MQDALPEDFAMLLECLRTTRGFDFTGYKDQGLTRRIRRRMESVGSQTYGEYADYLQVHPDEFSALFNTILINVTSFFRDPVAWDYLRERVVPKVLASHDPGRGIRVWSAGCASGQEAYSLAMVFVEALGEDQGAILLMADGKGRGRWRSESPS
jgi:two-component system CheB/CheR fusion protein